MEHKNTWQSLTSSLTLATLLKNLKPWRSFCNPSEFSPPKEIPSRLQENCRHFASNYAVVMAVLMFLGVLSQPSFFLTLVVLGVCWYLLLSVKNLTLYGEEVTDVRKNIAMLVVSGVATVFVAGTTVFCVLGITFISIGLHALFHEEPKEVYEFQV